MHRPPANLELGDHLNQAEIESLFDTGFGYQISGINVRKDDHENRYILLFANEDGPYSDRVQSGEFEYIGEGLSGDQKESSTGNAALIKAISTSTPIYFFYKGTGAAKWEYQGEVDVLDYDYEPRDGRNVFVFQMAHLDEPGPANDVGLFFVAVNDEWLTRFKTSVVNPFKLAGRANVPSQLEGTDSVRVWGTTATDSGKKQAAIDRLKQDDVVLFYHDGAFIGAGTVGRVFESQKVGDWLWNSPESRHIYTLNDYREDVPTVEEVRSMLGYKNDRFVNSSLDPVAEEKVGELVRQFGSLEAALFGSTVHEIPEPTEEEIQTEKSRLANALDSEATIVEDKTRYTIQKRKARDAAFRRLVTEAYDNTCAVCGSRRESPEGGFEVEAAHIYPKSEGGSEDPRNGIALCRLHHWAFDSGWLSISDDYEVLVRDEPGCEGYHEFKQYEGETVGLPTDTRATPSVEALQKHREIHELV
ncbi:HNH endonuclease [Haladaptatus sp. ZSTT2]|uniref:HNH endonuclease n=1 Tax=Haladaptatus sp. ZSTT2 TaxID=3120515 RepID=UPI00300EDDB3